MCQRCGYILQNVLDVHKIRILFPYQEYAIIVSYVVSWGMGIATYLLHLQGINHVISDFKKLPTGFLVCLGWYYGS